MKLTFYKYQGTGNDFVMVDNRDRNIRLSQKQIEEICDRRFGVGADGFILLENEEGYDFKMVYFNADGNEGSMCGNGGRCTVKFAHELGIFEKKTKFIAVDGLHEAIVDDQYVALKMSDTQKMELKEGLHFYNTGSPHVVKEVTQLDAFNVFAEGQKIRYSDFWKAHSGTNVNFVEVLDETQIKVRTYERGVEDETYSCGTGVTACAIDRFVSNGNTGPIEILTKGGQLFVSFEAMENGGFKNIWLKGPAQNVFRGHIGF